MESLKHLNTLHAWKTVEYLFFFPFKNSSNHPPMSQSKQILQLSFPKTRSSSCRVFYLVAGASLWGWKSGRKKIKTLAKLLKTRSMSTSLLHLLRKWTSSEETWSRWPHINRPSSPPLKAFRTELFCDQLGKVFKYPAYLYTDGFLSIRPPAQSVIDRICA